MNIKKTNKPINIQKISTNNNREDMAKVLYETAKAGFNHESPWKVKHFYQTLEAENSVVFTASTHDSLKEKTIGLLIASITLSEGDIYMVVVDEDYKQGQVAYRLFKHLIDYGRKHEVEILYLEVRKSNILAIGLYKKLGFEEIGLRRAYYSHPIEDALIMQLTI